MLNRKQLRSMELRSGSAVNQTQFMMHISPKIVIEEETSDVNNP